jgi:putative Ig domain-containing protein
MQKNWHLRVWSMAPASFILILAYVNATWAQTYKVPYQTVISVSNKSLPAGTVGIAYGATLSGRGGLAPYTWGIVSGSLPNGLSLDSNSGTISGTPTTAGVSNFTVQITDKRNTSATANLSLTVEGRTNGNLSGNYVFTFSGYNRGTTVLMAGSFVADGDGSLTSGVLDYNDGTGELPDNNPTPQTFVTGSSYAINPDGSGTMTIVTNLPETFQFTVVIRSDGSGSLIQSDPANPQAYGSGAIMAHTPLSQGEIWPLCGSNVAVGLFGLDSSLTARYAAAGQFQFDPNTCVDAESGIMDVNDGGAWSSNTTFSGAFNQYNTNTTRGVAGLTLHPGGRHFYAFYLVSSNDHETNKLILLSTDPVSEPANLTLWSGLGQPSLATGWDNSNLAGTAVAELNALDTTPATDVTAGLFLGNGAKGNNCQNNAFDAATFTYDENQGGKCNGGTCGQPQSSQGTYCVDKNTGRVTLTGFSGAFGGAPPVFYLVNTNQGFVVGTDPAVTSGYFEPQTGSPFATSSLFGLYVGGTINPVTAMVTNAVSWLYADGNGNINGTENTSGPRGPGPQNITYTYTVDNTGRTVVQQSGNAIGIGYVISNTRFVLIPATDPSPALSLFGQ